MTEHLIQITQGEQAASKDPEAVISTLLGSCVAVCLWDPLAKVGGMNHILHSEHGPAANPSEPEGVHAMETLINAAMKLGAKRGRLQAKVFGGAQMVPGLSNIGSGNAAFSLGFLRHEGINVAGKSLGGREARQLLFWPTTGAARQRTVGAHLAARPRAAPRDTRCGTVELF